MLLLASAFISVCSRQFDDAFSIAMVSLLLTRCALFRKVNHPSHHIRVAPSRPSLLWLQWRLSRFVNYNIH